MSVYLTVGRWVPRLTLMDLIIILIFSPEMHPSSDGSTESEKEEGEETADALWIAIIEVVAAVGRGRVETGCYFGFTPFGKTKFSLKFYDFAPFHGKLKVDRLC